MSSCTWDSLSTSISFLAACIHASMRLCLICTRKRNLIEPTRSSYLRKLAFQITQLALKSITLCFIHQAKQTPEPDAVSDLLRMLLGRSAMVLIDHFDGNSGVK